MALTLNNFIGFETDGLEEAAAIVNAPDTGAVIVRTGTYALKEVAGANIYKVGAFVGGGDAGNYYIFGFGIYKDNRSVGDDTVVAKDDNDTPCWTLKNTATGFDLRDAGGVIIDSFDMSLDEWHFIEVAWERDAAGAIVVDLDGAEVINEAAESLIGTGAALLTYNLLVNSANFDDIYCYSGGAGAGDFLSPAAEVLRAYQNTVEDATDQGSALDQGTWALAGDTPGVDDGAPAGYTAAGALTGYTICDEGARDGPDGDITGDVEGGKWLHRISRSGGGGTVHFKRWGKNAAITDTIIVTNAAWTNYFQISEDGTRVPTINTDYFSQGIGKQTGGRDIFTADMWSFLLHVVAVGPPTGQPTPIRTQGTPTGSGYRDRIGGWN